MRAATEFPAHVRRQRSDVGSARAGRRKFKFGVVQLCYTKVVDPDSARLARNFLALARQAVQSHSVFFQGGKHRRHLLQDRKSTRLNSSHLVISYAVFCLKKKKIIN